MIHWRIVDTPEAERDFLNFWKQQAVIHDRVGLVGEFLSRTEDVKRLGYITWDLDDRPGEYRSFVNVGIWKNEADFHEQIAQYFDDAKPIKPFEYLRRVRTVLRPKEWRIGDGDLPESDSGGTL